MLNHPELTPCPLPPGNALCEEPNKTSDPSHPCVATRQVAPRRRTSILNGTLAAVSGNDASVTMQRHQQDGRQGTPSTLLTRPSGAAQVPARRRVSLLVAESAGRCLVDRRQVRQEEERPRDTHILKKPRRRTIYVPSDDTTILTLHPGLPCEPTGNSSFSLITDCQKSKNRRSDLADSASVQGLGRRNLAAAPKRAPLQPTLKTLQEVIAPIDRFGQGHGKENVPSYALGMSYPDKNSSLFAVRRASIFAHEDEFGTLPLEMPLASETMKQNLSKHVPSKVTSHGQHRTSVNQSSKRLRGSILRKRNSIYYGTTRLKSVKDQAHQSTGETIAEQSSPLPVNGKRSPTEHFPVFENNINHAQMFEEEWLNDKETALTQLLNHFLETRSSCISCQFQHQEDCRQMLMQLYQSPECLLLYQRIRASLLYGAL